MSRIIGALPSRCGGHAEDGADGENAGAADAGDGDVPRPVAKRWDLRRRNFFDPNAQSAWRFFRLPPWTVTKDGQKPLTQEKSLLQLDWLIWRLRPNSVSSGSMEMQFDCTEQSPQPSQTAELMKTRFGGSSISPRLRRRRFSAAQV